MSLVFFVERVEKLLEFLMIEGLISESNLDYAFSRSSFSILYLSLLVLSLTSDGLFVLLLVLLELILY